VYVVLPCNKQKTIELLQEIQRLAKEANQHVTDLVYDSMAVAIENDSQLVFDALAVQLTEPQKRNRKNSSRVKKMASCNSLKDSCINIFQAMLTEFCSAMLWFL
jgi:hypothetical protein